MLRAGWILGVCCLLAPATARPQLLRGDSLRVLNAAQSAQRNFERIRRQFLPTTGDAGTHACEAAVGRMCHWQDDDGALPVAEPRSIANARFSLVSTLGRLAKLSPGDDWIAGEHIRYMVGSGQDSAAVSAARACTPSRWYCKILVGYALHASGRYGAAAAQFNSALAEMPATERCRWNDISVLLSDDERDNYNRLPCGQRDSVEQRFWELAQPSFIISGNDRRTEHFSRALLADLSQDAANAYGLNWGSDMRELLIRYGEPGWYTTTWPPPFSEPPTPIGHDKTPSFHFVAEMTGNSARWDAHAHIARERYAPPYIDTLTDLAAQFAMMKRGDSALVFAVYNDTSPGKAVLGLPDEVRDTAPADLRHAHVRRARTAWKAMMVAMEQFDPRSRRDAQARVWLAPPSHARGAPDLSTLLLFAADTSAPTGTLDDALALALTANDLRGTRQLGLYWEVYGVAAKDSSGGEGVAPATTDSAATAPSESSSVLVTVVRTDGGLMRWLGSALHITQRDSPLAVRWRDTRSDNGIAVHSVVLDLTHLAEGTYRVSVAVGSDSTHRTEVSREIRLR